MKKKAMGLWVRVSDPKQLVNESDVHHQVRGEEFIKNRGWEVKKIYRLGALSGESVMKYSEAKIMMRDIRIGLIDGLVFSEISRLARNTRELIEIAEYFDKYGAVLIAMNMSIDMSTPMGRHFYRTMGSNAQLEREMIVERINGSIITRAQLGKRIGGHAPLGYQYVDKKLEINPDEVAVCTAVFETFLECKRKRTTARLLNEKGYRTRKGNLFSDSTVKRILTDSVYKGLYRMNHSTVSKEGKRIEKPKEEWFFHEVASIIPKELWENVNTILRNQYSPRKKPMNTKIHLFTQYVYCHCGARMFTHNKTKNYICKDHCGNLINKEDLEEIFKTELHSYLDSQSNIEQYFKQLQTNLVSKKQQRQTLIKEKEKVNTKIQKLLDLHLQGQIKTEAFNSYHTKPYEQLQQLEQSISELEMDILAFDTQEKTGNNLIFEAKNMYKNWSSLHRDKKRNVIETVTEKIIVGTQDISINLYKLIPDGLMPSFLESSPNGQHNQQSANCF